MVPQSNYRHCIQTTNTVHTIILIFFFFITIFIQMISSQRIWPTYTPYCKSSIKSDGSRFCMHFYNTSYRVFDIAEAEKVCSTEKLTLLKLYTSSMNSMYLEAIKSWDGVTDFRTTDFYITMGLLKNPDRLWMWNDGYKMTFSYWGAEEPRNGYEFGFVVYNGVDVAWKASSYFGGRLYACMDKINANNVAGIAVGSAAGGVTFVAFPIIIVFLCKRKKKNNKKDDNKAESDTVNRTNTECLYSKLYHPFNTDIIIDRTNSRDTLYDCNIPNGTIDNKANGGFNGKNDAEENNNQYVLCDEIEDNNNNNNNNNNNIINNNNNNINNNNNNNNNNNINLYNHHRHHHYDKNEKVPRINANDNDDERKGDGYDGDDNTNNNKKKNINNNYNYNIKNSDNNNVHHNTSNNNPQRAGYLQQGVFHNTNRNNVEMVLQNNNNNNNDNSNNNDNINNNRRKDDDQDNGRLPYYGLINVNWSDNDPEIFGRH
ncbi:hypothetical protein HELRODRAFT_182584 [Helobdella robusta]|uniref:C-type lectin domain-containing protein n=1 Tax=Helobdella robusta TaxID=6412 RepID=T1FIE7_HELRO|nr:hypothetical protein HELRODRAFT_182584 [Helobdella robusta]ESN90875.1 hypothetical protein HELRODRAFT_182584 [Helobdella robusta]